MLGGGGDKRLLSGQTRFGKNPFVADNQRLVPRMRLICSRYRLRCVRHAQLARRLRHVHLRLRSSMISLTRANRIRRVRSFSRIMTAAPASANARAFGSWWLFVTLGDGTKMEGLPMAVDFGKERSA